MCLYRHIFLEDAPTSRSLKNSVLQILNSHTHGLIAKHQTWCVCVVALIGYLHPVLCTLSKRDFEACPNTAPYIIFQDHNTS